MCHMSHIMCHVSGRTCQVSRVRCHAYFFYKVVEKVCGGSVINGAYHVYFIKKDDKLDPLAVNENYNFYDTQTETQVDMATL